MLFAVVVCVLILATSLGVSMWLGLNPAEAAGMMAGASTASPVVGAAEDTVLSLGLSEDETASLVNVIPVCYAMTYVFGTIGAVWLLGYVGPAIMGGLEKVKAQTHELEKTMSQSGVSSDPAFFDACREVAFRAFELDGSWMTQPRSVQEIETKFAEGNRRLTVERIKCKDGSMPEVTPATSINPGDCIVLAGRREMMASETPDSWLGHEIPGVDLLTFPVEQVEVTVSRKCDCHTIADLLAQPCMDGVEIKSITRDGVLIPPFTAVDIRHGDVIEIVGLKKNVDKASQFIGFPDKPTLATDFVFIGFGILLGGLLGALAFKIGNVSVSLGASGGALVMGLIMGWLRSKRPTYGAIPKASLWVFNNLGLNMYIAVIGIASGPSFISSFKEVGPVIFIAGLIVTLVPMFLAILIGHKIFKFHPAITLGCCAGARKTTAGLGAVQERLGSSVPALGYTITYAVSNTLLILFGIVLVLLLA